MNDDQLDDEIRALMSAVVADAPAPKPLPSMDDVAAAPVVAIRRSRGRAVVWTGIAVAASLAAITVFWSSRNDKGSVTAATSSTAEQTTIASLTTTTTAQINQQWWPADLVVIIASDRGIERVTAENNMSVITRRDEPLTGSVAFETVDGQLISGETLMDVALIDERLDASGTPDFPWVDRSALDGSGANVVQVDFVHPIARLTHGLDILVGQSLEPDGGWRPLLITQSGTSAGDSYWTELGIPGPFDSVDDPRLFSVSPSGSTIGWVEGDQLVLADGRSFKIPPGSEVIEVDLTDDFVALTRTEGPGQLIDLRNGDAFPAPAAGRLTISMRATVDPTPQIDFPEGDVRAVVTQRDSDSDDGVWIVTDDEFVQVDATAGGPAYLARDTLLFSPKAGGIVAVDRATGATQTLRATGQVVDAAVLGGQLYYLYTDGPLGETTYLYLHGPGGDTYITTNFAYTDLGHLTWHLGPGVIVGSGAYYPSVWPEFYDFAGNYLAELSEQYAPATQPPDGNRMLYTMNPEGLWGIVDGDLLTLRQWGDPTVLDTITIPDGAQALDLDVSADRIVVTYNLGTNGADAGREATRNGDGTWTWSDLPGYGWATMPRASDPGSPFDVTPLTAPPYTPSVALAGDFGVKLVVGDGTEKVITTDPSDRVLLRRDGSISFKSPDFGAYPRGWNPVTGEISEHWAGTNWVAEPILHDDLGALTGTPFGDFLFSVADQVYRYADERRWPAPGVANTRLSCSYDGWVIGNGIRFAMGDSEPPEWLGTAGGEWALTPDGQLVASTTDGLIRVRRTSDGAVVYEQPIGDRVISEIDVSGEWLAYIETPNDTPTADSTSRAVLVHLPSGRSLTYEGALSVSLANTDI